MGRSSSSCLRIIPCTGAPAADEDHGVASPEAKASSDRRRWSFRKKSGRDRVLSSSGISEPVSVGYNKESPEESVDNFRLPNILSIPEKDSIEERPLSSSSELINPLVADRNTTATEHKVQDSDAVIIQAAIRGYHARREFLERKNVVKLEASARRVVVRRQLVASLRCVQAIIKIQALVRARQTCRQAIYSATKDDEFQVDTERLSSLENGVSNVDREYRKDEDDTELATYGAPNKVPHTLDSLSDLKLAPGELGLPTDGDGISKSPTDSLYQPSIHISDDRIVSLTKSDQDQPLEDEALGMSPEKNTYIETVNEISSDTLLGQASWQFDGTAQSARISFSDKPESAGNNSKRSIKRASSEPLENEGNRVVSGSRKTCNPAFAAVQSRFEELSSPSYLGKTVNSAYPDALAEPKSNAPIPQPDSVARTKDFSLVNNSLSNNPRIQIAASECGTEISISSTLDSPDRSEVEGEEIVLEIESSRKGNCVVPVGVNDSVNLVNLTAVAKSSSIELKILETQRSVDGDGKLTILGLATEALQVKQQTEEPSTPVMQAQMENSVDPQLYKSSPEGTGFLEGTPNSHVTASESHGTPSSQVSIESKKRKNEGNMLTRKHRPELLGKRSPSTPNNDSGGSTGNLPKDSKNGKRRNSFGMAKTDHADHEPKTSGSSAVPSYMQATESARAKAHTSISPKLSPDVHDKDIYQKKRHSLPIANGKQGSSPRMQRSPSQVHQVPNVNGNHSPNNSTGTMLTAVVPGDSGKLAGGPLGEDDHVACHMVSMSAFEAPPHHQPRHHSTESVTESSKSVSHVIIPSWSHPHGTVTESVHFRQIFYHLL